jgi:alanine racemase
MDLVCLDVTALPGGSVAEGDWATLIGGSITIDEVAALAGTIAYEVLTAMGARLERVYLDEEPKAQRPA